LQETAQCDAHALKISAREGRGEVISKKFIYDLILTHFQHEVVETLFVYPLKRFFQIESKIHQQSEMRPSDLDGIFGLVKNHVYQINIPSRMNNGSINNIVTCQYNIYQNRMWKTTCTLTTRDGLRPLAAM